MDARRYLNLPHSHRRRPRTAGFTLVELMIVVAVIAIIATVAVPNLMASRLSANETRAIALLRSAVSAQSQFKVRGVVDQDLDGIGEYGWEGELAGAIGPRDPAGVPGTPLNPPMISFRPSDGGYNYSLYLPGPAGAPLASNNGGTPGGEDPDLCEMYFLIYAWPSAIRQSGRRAFVVNQEGVIFQTDNRGGAQGYDGSNNPPPPLAALSGLDMTTDISNAGNPAPANDNGIWVPID